MPQALRKPCPTPGCPELITRGQRRCPTHQRQHETARGSRQARGYDRTHDRLRKAWAPLVATGTVQCHAKDCLHETRTIKRGQRWDLGHTDDRTAWTGPEHAKCNRAAGGRASHPGG